MQVFNKAGARFLQSAAVYNKTLPMRGMKLHEYQAGALLHSYNIGIPLGNVAHTPDEA